MTTGHPDVFAGLPATTTRLRRAQLQPRHCCNFVSTIARSTCTRQRRNSRIIAAGPRPASWAARISRSCPGVTGTGWRFVVAAGRVARPEVFFVSGCPSGVAFSFWQPAAPVLVRR